MADMRDDDSVRHHELLAPLAALARCLRERRTVNLFEPDRRVPESVMTDAVNLARWAPNHRLTEPWHFYLLGEETRGKLIDLMVAMAIDANGEAAGEQRRKRLQAIPGWFVLTTTRHENPLIDRENYAACSCAAQNLMLYLWQAGVGVKWTSGAIIRDQRLGDILGVDLARHPVVGLFWYGYPRMVPKQKRKPAEQIITRMP